MEEIRPQRRTQRNPWRALALTVAGLGLLALSLGALFLLPKSGSSAVPDDEESAVPIKVNYPAPEVNVKDLSGQEVSLTDMRGRVVLVNNWTTWCPPCQAEMPALEAYFQAHRQENFTIIAIDGGEPYAEVTRFVEEYQLSFTVWVDFDLQALAAFQNRSIPNSYVIDRDGMVRLAWTGAISEIMLEKYVTPLLEE